ncbi:MAG: lipoyl synthase [Armatimonadetes bacterium]|nr:lipoyl synthase [Armatimonadota bacterium]
MDTKPVNNRLPPWLTVRLPRPNTVNLVEKMMRDSRLHTVCESARCPNLPECWSKKTATFMILGDVCTRNCGFCAIKTGKPLAVDAQEPQRVAEIAKEMELKHIVVTSVNRDDLPDEGSGQFAATIRALQQTIPNAIVEVLTPDFKCKAWCVRRVVEAHPDIYNHNIETVDRLSPIVRPQAKYQRTLQMLQMVKQMDPSVYTKSGIMVGLGETRDEILKTMEDLRSHNVDALTLGQYLRPTRRHLPVMEYVHPDTFAEYQEIGEKMGFLFVAAGPFVRSSYNAIEFSKRILAERLEKVGA